MKIIVTNTIEQNKVLVGFNPQDGTFNFPTVEINTAGDIDFNTLVLKMAELLQHKRDLQIEYKDEHSLIETNSKINLIKKTLDEIYGEFNRKIDLDNQPIVLETDKVETKPLDMTDQEDDLPF